MRCGGVIHRMDVGMIFEYVILDRFWVELYEYSRRMLRLIEAYDRCPVHRKAKSRVGQYAWQSFHNAGPILQETLAGMRHRDFQGCDTPANSLQYHH